MKTLQREDSWVAINICIQLRQQLFGERKNIWGILLFHFKFSFSHSVSLSSLTLLRLKVSSYLFCLFVSSSPSYVGESWRLREMQQSFQQGGTGTGRCDHSICRGSRGDRWREGGSEKPAEGDGAGTSSDQTAAGGGRVQNPGRVQRSECESFIILTWDVS